jgi:hypothetical protein
MKNEPTEARRATRAPRRRASWLLLVAVMAAGCAARRGADVTFHDPNMDFSLIQNVAVLPFANLSGNNNAGAAARDVLMTMLQATGSIYVLPPGEVARGISRTGLQATDAPTPEEVVQLAGIVGADAIITGTVLEYGEVRSAASSANVATLSVKMLEAQSGRVVWSASASAGGVTGAQRMFGGGGRPMDEVLRKSVSQLLDRLFG